MPRSPSRNARSTARAGRTFAGASGGGGGGAFDPLSLNGWLLFAQGKNIAGTNGATVTSWDDESPCANDLLNISGCTVVTGATPSGGRVLRLATGTIPVDNLGFATTTLRVKASTTLSPASNFYIPSNLIDGDAGTEWVASTNALPQWVRLQVVAGATVVTSYSLRATSGQTSNAPAAWVFAGSNDGDTYTTLDTQSGISLSSASATTYNFSNSTAYKFYRLTVSARNGGGTELRFAQFSLGGITTSTPTAGAGEIWLVIKSNTTSATWWQIGNSGSANHCSFSGTVYDDFGATARDSFVPSVNISTAYRILHISITSGGAKVIELDNASQFTGTRTLGWNVAPMLANGWIGDYAFIGARNVVSDSTEKANMIAYLNTEHGLTVT